MYPHRNLFCSLGVATALGLGAFVLVSPPKADAHPATVSCDPVDGWVLDAPPYRGAVLTNSLFNEAEGTVRLLWSDGYERVLRLPGPCPVAVVPPPAPETPVTPTPTPVTPTPTPVTPTPPKKPPVTTQRKVFTIRTVACVRGTSKRAYRIERTRTRFVRGGKVIRVTWSKPVKVYGRACPLPPEVTG